VNGKTYHVIPSGNIQKAADTLALLENHAKDFLGKIDASMYDDTTFFKKTSRWSGTISEIPISSESIAYSLDKTDIFMCIRDQDGHIHEFDDLFFVLLHEIAHTQNDTYGHDDGFWKVFKQLLELANKVGALRFKNYDRQSVVVCGKRIESNPMSCVVERECFSELRPIRPLI
jgi:hypothetical protein